jgi:hypothetical protein
MIDYEALSHEDRLALIEATLGLLPSGPDFQSRATFVAFQLAGERPQEQIEDSLARLEEAQPGWFDEVVAFARDVHGFQRARR